MLALTAAIPVLTNSASAQFAPLSPAPPPTRNTYGEMGMLDMPSAHMEPDGYFGGSFGQVGNQKRYGVWFQALPWLDTSFRYSRAWQGFYDRSLGLKVRFSREDAILPDVSIGLRDILGTGVFNGEYLVASKHIWSFDLTGGIGWGRLADNSTLPNPLGFLFSSFKSRPSYLDVIGPGNVNYKQFFHGKRVGVFGGIQWQSPVDGLSLLVEYSSDQYEQEQFRNLPLSKAVSDSFKPRIPVNVGLHYDVDNVMGLSAGWMYGKTFGVAFTLSGDASSTYSSALRVGPTVPDPAIRTNNTRQSALTQLSLRVKSVRSALHNGTWVDVPTAGQHARQQLLQSLMSETKGVRDVDYRDASVTVNAHLGSDPQKQCQTYAQIAGANGSEIRTFAVTDLEDPSGQVVFCQAQNSLAHVSDMPSRASVLNTDALENKLRVDLTAQDVVLMAMAANQSEIWLYYSNYRYRTATEAAGRAARVLMADTPSSIEIFHLVPVWLGVPGQEIKVLRSGLERSILQSVTRGDLGDTVVVTPAAINNPTFNEVAASYYPKFNWSLDPKLTQRVFDPDAPIQFMVYGDLAAMLQLWPGLNLRSELTGTIWTNYTFTRPADSVLPHVRTDLLQYQKHGKYGISNLQIDYTTRITPEVFVQAKGGILEDMFVGVGGQVVWRPTGSRLTFGADAYQVWQREYHRLFGLRDYGVFTGHISAYYQSPWYDLNLAVHAGRYLAGDYGATFELTRRFSTGVEIGAWATFTDVPFAKFGEGSFDKGIIIRIPFEWGLPIWSQAAYDLHLASLTRDGGQRLSGDDSLYGETYENSYGYITQHLDQIVEP